ncbi:MAG TPA: LytTR family DNA-binding domain-containing protein [Ferruginibacter sp.]|nr:LytTR family DNA-binding domain-containing protein [Ferruginibacter sp.]
MTKVIIIEDEKPAAHTLAHMLYEITDRVQVEAMLGTVAESISYLSDSPPIDLILSDVQLPDGSSFEIFKELEVKTPVIFTTAYDNFMMNAFAHNGIDYLLKPIDINDLKKALTKFEMLEKHFNGHQPALHRFVKQYDLRKKNRMVVRKGMLHISLRLDEIVLFYTESKMVFVLDKNGKKYTAEKTLTELEEILDSSRFFRANRQYIININFIKGFKSFDKVKMLLDLSIPELEHIIIISQENCAPFKKWMYDA